MADNTQLRTYRDGVAVITGGASGIGRSLGKALAKRGCTVILADLQLEMALAVASEIHSTGGNATAVKLDVTDNEAVETLLKGTFEKYGRIDYLFNNAGIAINGAFHDFTLADWRRCIDVNLLGVVHGLHSIYPIMAKQGFGHIINTASTAGLFPWPTTIAYTATKHAVVGLTTATRAELAHSNINVSALCPGTIKTPMIAHDSSGERWAGEYDQEKLEKFFKSAGGMDPCAFAEAALDKVARNKAIIVLPRSYKILWWINRLMPAVAIALASKISQAILSRVK
ncbi:SDR family NAD(P)-dependent oxidoreductase [bacterium]|nr:MAG: SDR family NAD(P)-dependent oxidoreductase [bacterium]